jgi:hypothetical protein
MKKVVQPHGGSINILEKGESGNLNGRPKKSFRMLNDTLKKEGYEPLSKADLLEAYSLILSIDEEKIQELADDDTQPLAIRLIIQDMTNEQNSGKAIQDIRNYLFGGATQKSEMKISSPFAGKSYNDLSDEDRDLLFEIANKYE